MIRKIFKKQKPNKKIDALIKKYKIPRAYLSINRKNVANAIFIGLFFAMMPMPMQMLAVILLVPFITFNVPLGLALVWLNNPFTIVFIFFGEYQLGALVLGTPTLSEMSLTVEWFQNNLDTIFLPLIVGALICGTVLAILGRYAVLFLWKRSVHKAMRKKQTKK